LSLDTSRTAKDPDGEGDYIRESLYGINWEHEWNDKVTSNFNLYYMRESYTGDLERLDKSIGLSAYINYEFKRWTDVALYIEYTDKDSTNEIIVYDKSVVGLNFTFSL
jgi:hypothetical protein